MREKIRITSYNVCYTKLLRWLVLLLTAAAAARKASNLQIVAALRGDSSVKSDATFGRKLLVTGLVLFGLLVMGKHVRDVFITTPDPDNSGILLTAVAWLGACFTLLFLLICFLHVLEKPLHRLLRLLGVPKLSLLLAVKYPRRHVITSYSIHYTKLYEQKKVSSSSSK